MRVARYSVVSAGSIILTQILLVAFTLATLPPASANIVAVLVASVPAFILSRTWTWRDRDDTGMTRQAVVFWSTVVVGLVASTAAVSAVGEFSTAPQSLAAASLAAFGALWMVRFVVLDRIAFRDEHRSGAERPSLGKLARTYAPAALAIAAIGVAAAVHAWGFADYPTRFDDEGTYVSQAWAVMSQGELSHYTYWYDHPPVGWLQLIPWLWVSGAFERGASTIAAGREMMLLVHIASCALIYLWARRLKINAIFASAAVLLFSLSPLAIYWQRQVLLDNFAVMWTLAAFVWPPHRNDAWWPTRARVRALPWRSSARRRSFSFCPP
jgi:putative flippase GtrA